MMECDAAIVGSGILGLATGLELTRRHPGIRVVVLEKESDLFQHQSGRNSGVLHSGVYYAPGSLKARTCRAGKQRMEAFCQEEGIAFDACGKVIVAIRENQVPALETILERGTANGVDVRRIGTETLHQLEPAAAGIDALHVPEAGIINYREVGERMAAIIQSSGGRILYHHPVTGLREVQGRIEVSAGAETLSARVLINCAGLYADRIARLQGLDPDVRIVPFKGVYHELAAEARSLCRGLIYPVPDPAFPFLGVHLTKCMDGRVLLGPNAVLAMGREAYAGGDGNVAELLAAMAWPGFRKLACKHWRTGAGEIRRSLSTRAFAEAVRELVPSVEDRHLQPARAGIRAQALHRDGRLADDFIVEESECAVHIINAPSPAATASMEIARNIADRVDPRLALS